MNRRIIILFSLVSLIALAATDAPMRAETQFLERSQALTQKHDYVAALTILDQGLLLYPSSELLIAAFRKNSELYIVHEISTGYQQIDKNSHDVKAYVRVSEAFSLAGERLKALEVLTEGTFENPKSSVLWSAIGKLEQTAGRLAEANSAFEEAKRQIE
ncbi:MAG: hypothetical protein WCK49_08095 [Myxococcaceae bacterium]